MHLAENLSVTSGRFTDPGPKPENQDFLGMHVPEGPLLATKGISACIADGVSAASAAREASETTIRSFLNDYYETPESWQVKTAGQRVLTAINRWLYGQGQGSVSAEKGYVTTFTAVVFKSQTAHIFHIGDSRIYRLRSGELEQISRDHSSRVSADACYLTRAMGISLTPRIDYHTLDLEPGDLFLLSTDGIHEFLSHSKLLEILSSGRDPEAIAAELGDATDHSDDNRSALIVRVDTLPDQDKDDVFRQLSTLPFPPDLLPGQSMDGLMVEKLIAASPNSQLYLVHDTCDNNRPLVLKTPSIHYQNDPGYLERFALEEWIGLRTDNANLVKAVRRETPRRFLYYVLEPVKGPTLDEWSKQNPSPSVESVVKIVRGIVSGTRALHRKDTLHQDLKPGNILLDADGTVKIIDYGSCRIGGISEIATPFHRNEALGTLDFSAPEYRLGATPTTSADLFSIATITYYLLTGGQHPYGDPWARAKILRDFHTLSYTSATAHNPMVPLWMDATLRKALSILPDRRHESMSEFVRFLEHPDPDLITTAPLPMVVRNPVLVWKLVALFFFVAWVITWIAK
ncbi:protein phosphatase 2C domain-containing protein [Haloferula chungangensis]|uniref:Protein phosphatase 2C domain-containing protein n=1 Tax=Haloferula chungangensis TaxID=1048331 RepID=A0ABW2L3L0_9BACT